MQSCSCPECVSACRNDPGRLIPEDIDRIAGFLKITREELIADYCVKIPHVRNAISALGLAPAKMKGRRFIAQPGTIVPEYYTEEKGTCIFLDDKGFCSIHSVKPYECGAYMGCRDTFNGRPYRDKQVEEFFFSKWKNIKLP